MSDVMSGAKLDVSVVCEMMRGSHHTLGAAGAGESKVTSRTELSDSRWFVMGLDEIW